MSDKIDLSKPVRIVEGSLLLNRRKLLSLHATGISYYPILGMFQNTSPSGYYGFKVLPELFNASGVWVYTMTNYKPDLQNDYGGMEIQPVESLQGLDAIIAEAVSMPFGLPASGSPTNDNLTTTMNNEPKLDIDKPMQTRSGIKVIEYHVLQSATRYPLICLLETADSIANPYTLKGEVAEGREHPLDLINVPDPEVDYQTAYCDLYESVANLLVDVTYHTPCRCADPGLEGNCKMALLPKWDVLRKSLPPPTRSN